MSWTSEAEKAEAVAKARFFRGWAYLRLAECFGGVPIVPEYSEELKFDYQRSTREDVYKFAVEDFKYAASGLPEYPKVDGDVSAREVQHALERG
ncbi:MAG: RagB/SusD family nutrient uptake outer membrane protein [Candidatus Cryptobacteroides sp.]